LEEADSLSAVNKGIAEIIYATPEQLTHPDFIETLVHAKVRLLIIDEAH
jgi:ATP-dependent DNA helicase RecQ